MAHLLKELRKTTTPRVREVAGQKEPPGADDSPKTHGVSYEDRVYLLTKLQDGCAYKEARRELKKEKGVDVPLRTLARWAKEFVSEGRIVNDKGEAWNDLSNLGEFLDANHLSLKGSRRGSRWWYWGIDDIRFTLIFGVPSPRYAGEQAETLAGLFQEETGRRPGPVDWISWVSECIEKYWRDPEKALSEDKILRALRDAAPSVKRHALSGRVQFCRQSVKAALKKRGYVCERHYLAGKRIWRKCGNTGKPRKPSQPHPKGSSS